MSTTGTVVAAMARRILADSTDESFADADILAYLNEGVTRFAQETHCCQAFADKTVTASPYAFSNLETAAMESILTVLQILLTASGSFLEKEPISETSDRLAATVTTPTRFRLFGDYILFNTTAAILAVETTMYFSYVPVNLTALSETVDIPSQWIPAIVKYIVFCCHLSCRDAGLANGAYQEYLSIVGQAKALAIGKAM